MKTLAMASLAVGLVSGCGVTRGAPTLSDDTLALAPAAQTGDSPLRGEATIENGLAYDGCSFVVTIADVDYAADAATAPTVQTFATSTGKTRAAIEYRLAPGTAWVECGWGARDELPAISVLSLRPL